jgi:hypothetical protein
MEGSGVTRGNATTSRSRGTMGGHGAARGRRDERRRRRQIRGGGICREDATTSWTGGARKAEREVMMQREERPRNSDERGWSSRKTQQPTIGVRGNGWQLQSCRLTGDNTTTSRGGRKQDGIRGGGGGEGKLADVVLTTVQEAEAVQRDATRQPAGFRGGSLTTKPTLALYLLLAEEGFPQ